MKRGRWELTISGVTELDDVDREYIAGMIREGYTSGEVVQDYEGPGDNTDER